MALARRTIIHDPRGPISDLNDSYIAFLCAIDAIKFDDATVHVDLNMYRSDKVYIAYGSSVKCVKDFSPDRERIFVIQPGV